METECIHGAHRQTNLSQLEHIKTVCTHLTSVNSAESAKIKRSIPHLSVFEIFNEVKNKYPDPVYGNAQYLGLQITKFQKWFFT